MKNKTLILTGILALSSIVIAAQNSPRPTITVVKGNPTHQNDVAIVKKNLIIGPQRPECNGIMQTGGCYQVKEKKSQKKWEVFPAPIKGFNYKAGFEYVIEVKVERPKESLEGATEEYTYLRTISKKKIMTSPKIGLQVIN
ncbi:DUF4377 domain-containing protein [Chryseobacterium polytrichastri]|uniref:DUF4377 domain-containing protein n=1 Tax=Chryseobacterium polytrichastri TaxID=1302687 RepID=A0A1M7L374_9FLAO|nr:DUF4377 domain-containing protein [Chryseobacterium polytrichastri]SHM72316.1 protein of unknown function [Chryseobacterium polytrichastri]